MNLLLDTHILLWAASLPEKLPPILREALLEVDNQLWFSSANLWEINIKRSLGRDDFQVEPHRLWRTLLANGYRELPIRAEHALAVDKLPPLHKDPFDRILLAQARFEGMSLMTVDAALLAYGEGIFPGAA